MITVTISGTGETRDLHLIDPDTGHDIAMDFVDEWSFDEFAYTSDGHGHATMSDERYHYWARTLMRQSELLYDIRWYSYRIHPQAVQDALADIYREHPAPATNESLPEYLTKISEALDDHFHGRDWWSLAYRYKHLDEHNNAPPNQPLDGAETKPLG